ncbi:hypothetical protein LOC67_13235 [Stieleria sp. JC731]|uniref:hypothetical protein n=1 Tax=Pirellulaceae TaxID=2691357 RepID=UPI001E37CBAB|nr:hypothetical protein [Stieleria sp. JC731]MCC9601514.1 hypothetical protein [Stieleria sp. JC731]
MAGDLEDFLKRAAERRAQKQGKATGRSKAGGRPASRDNDRASAARPKRQAPQYTDSRRERQVRSEDDEPILLGEPIETTNPLAEQQRQLAEAKRRAEQAKRKLAETQRSLPSSDVVELGAEHELTGNAIEDLLANLAHPNGAQQAFLLKEILTRPNWDDL